MNRGYFKLWRKIEDSGIIGNADVCQMFLYLLTRASSRPRCQLVGKTPVDLQAGQLITGRHALVAALGSTERKVRTALETLQKMGIIVQQTSSKFTLISIVNWDRYQSEGPAGVQQNVQQASRKGPASVQQTSTIKEVKKEEVKNNINTILPGDGEDAAHGQEAAPPEPVYLLPLKAKAGEEKQFPVNKELFDVWEDAYPLVDVRAELREIKSWLVSNPKKRPASDMARFVNAWLDRAQNDRARQEARASPIRGHPVKSFQQQADESVWEEFRKLAALEENHGPEPL